MLAASAVRHKFEHAASDATPELVVLVGVEGVVPSVVQNCLVDVQVGTKNV